jgi:putative transposase
MARRPRLQIPGGVYHVTQRATDQETLFHELLDRVGFDHLLLRAAARYDWEIHDYCQLSNHFHVLLTTREPNIALGMQYLNSRYVQTFNDRHSRRGTLVQGRYYSGLVESEQHFLIARAYLALNPVDAGLCREPADWAWSGFGGKGKIVPPPDARLRRFVADYRARREHRAALALRDLSGL